MVTLPLPESQRLELLLDVNGRIDGASGANISWYCNTTNAYIAKLAQSNGTSGSVNEVPVANGSGGWNWAPVNTTGAGDIQVLLFRKKDQTLVLQTVSQSLNFVGNDVTADATAQTRYLYSHS